MEIDEKTLISESAAGDMSAFEELVLRYEKRIVAAAYHLCGNRDDGEDLAQETFIKAWQAIGGYRGQASFNTWLMAILTNLWRDRLRKKRVPQEPLEQEIGDGGSEIQRQWKDSGPGPDAVAESQEIREILSSMMQELKPEFKEALLLRDVQGFSYEEVAVITRTNLGTVKSRINRGRTQMKEMILQYQEQNPGFFRLSRIGPDKTQTVEGKEVSPHEG
jgi:RNA polymerase sigma-70 factor (ECF subfamily)